MFFVKSYNKNNIISITNQFRVTVKTNFLQHQSMHLRRSYIKQHRSQDGALRDARKKIMDDIIFFAIITHRSVGIRTIHLAQFVPVSNSSRGQFISEIKKINFDMCTRGLETRNFSKSSDIFRKNILFFNYLTHFLRGGGWYLRILKIPQG